MKKLLVSTLVVASLASAPPAHAGNSDGLLVGGIIAGGLIAAAAAAAANHPHVVYQQGPTRVIYSAPRRASSMSPPRDMRQRRARLRLSRHPPTMAPLLGPTSIKEPLVTNDCQPMSVVRGVHERASSPALEAVRGL
ncbi:MAG: hypothetical protein WAN05_19960 [Roseiarcus sp.]